MAERKKLSVVVSVYNEEEALGAFYNTTVPILADCGWNYELIFVNDGSTDKSQQLLEEFARENRRVKVIDFSRNFGHEAAMIAGIDHATGDGVICMDADLQHPPQSIPQILSCFENGYDVVSMIREDRKDGGLIKKITSKLFYKILNVLSPIQFEANASDFFAFTAPVAQVLKNEYREKVRYLRGYVQSVGFAKTTLSYEAASRVAGESKYSISKLLRFSATIICSFSDFPLKLGIYSGSIVALFGLILMIYSIVNKIVNDAPSGYSTIIVAISFMFAILLAVVGIIGQYIAVLFNEIKDRPIYIIQKKTNMD